MSNGRTDFLLGTRTDDDRQSFVYTKSVNRSIIEQSLGSLGLPKRYAGTG
jgi:hypothetical protein